MISVEGLTFDYPGLRALDDVSQLADVTGPAVGFKFGHGFWREAWPIGPLELHAHPATEMVRQQ